MDRVTLLLRLKAATEEATKNLMLPTSFQQGDKEKKTKTPSIHLMRLPDSTKAQKKAPYVIHQLITAKDFQPRGKDPDSSATVRSICCVYSENEEDGGMMLLNLMERMRIHLLKLITLPGGQFLLDPESGIEYLVYPDGTAPYFAGEMVSTWKTPSITKEVPRI